jgi:hypothetical protein
MRLALGCKTWTLALVLALGCSSSPPKRSNTGGSGGEDTGGTVGTGGSGTGGSGTGGSRTGGTGGSNTGGTTGGTGGSKTGGSGGSGGVDAGADGAIDGAADDAAVDTAPPDLAPDAPPVVYEMPRAPWLGKDIGPTGMQAGGVFLGTTPNGGQNYDLISSGTTGIGGTADAFFYMYQSVTGRRWSTAGW